MNNQDGQMTVELSVLLPVVIVLGIVLCNLALYIAACAKFDNVARTAVLTRATACNEHRLDNKSLAEITQDIKQNFKNSTQVEIDVKQTSFESAMADLNYLSFNSRLVTYICTLRYKPFPRALTIGAATYTRPLVLTHTITLVVDPCRSGGV